MTNPSPEKIVEDKNKLLSKGEKAKLREIVKDNKPKVKETAINGLENNYDIKTLINTVDPKKMNREQIAMVQLYANLLGNEIAIDGKFGPQTDKAITILKSYKSSDFASIENTLVTINKPAPVADQYKLFPTFTPTIVPEKKPDIVNDELKGIDVKVYTNIKNELLQAKSPITAEMVISSAKKYNVPVHYLLAFMKNDSSYGTAGKGARTKNPGNVGNDDGGRTTRLNTWQEGVDLCAKHIRKVIDAYKNVVGNNGMPTPWEIATGKTVNHKKFHGVYMTAANGPKRVTTIADTLVKKGIYMA